MAETKPIPTIADYPHVVDVTTRWNDNDPYGHVNNAIFYEYFDSVANAYLIEAGGLDIHGSDVIGLVVESGCRYHAPVEYPAVLRVGLRVGRLGDRSVTYELAVFTADGDDAVVNGYFSHVFVDRETRRPTAMPADIRTALERLVVG
ncbi:MAG TPA: thioesterase family protein [Aeromicrobium sp.]|nr:thioesterase family protein [Aeromicrobium sp.]